MWIACTAIDDFVRLAEKARAPVTVAVAKAVSYVLPNFERFNFRDVAIYQTTAPIAELATSLGYGAIYMAALVALASAMLYRREML